MKTMHEAVPGPLVYRGIAYFPGQEAITPEVPPQELRYRGAPMRPATEPSTPTPGFRHRVRFIYRGTRHEVEAVYSVPPGEEAALVYRGTRHIPSGTGHETPETSSPRRYVYRGVGYAEGDLDVEAAAVPPELCYRGARHTPARAAPPTQESCKTAAAGLSTRRREPVADLSRETPRPAPALNRVLEDA